MPSYKKQLETANKTTDETIKGFIYKAGVNNVVLTAPHAQGPSADLFTGELAYRIGERTGAHVFISTLSREKLDLNLPSKLAKMSPFRLELSKRVQLLSREYKDVLAIDLHGMEKNEGPDIYLGTLDGATAKIEVINLIIEEFEENGFETWLAEFFEPSLIGGDIIASLSTLGNNIHAVQIEINQKHRQIGNKKILTALVRVLNQWNKKYGPIWGTASILRSIDGAKFPIETKQDLTRYLGGIEMEIHWAKGKRRRVKDIVEIIDDKCFPIKNSKELIRVFRKSS